jgi:hypothetical protein
VRNKFIELHGLPAAFPFDLYLLSAFKMVMIMIMIMMMGETGRTIMTC